MMNEIPVNKQAAIFLSRRKRVESLKEALARFADHLLDSSVGENIAAMLIADKNGDSPTLEIAVQIHKDMSSPGFFVARMKTQWKTELGEEHYFRPEALTYVFNPTETRHLGRSSENPARDKSPGIASKRNSIQSSRLRCRKLVLG